jgi:hypothetical protein
MAEWGEPIVVAADEVLAELAREATVRRASAGEGSEEGVATDAPAELLTNRLAYDLREVWRLAGKDAREERGGLAVPGVPVLIAHTLSLLPDPDGDPGRVGKFGYEVELPDVDAIMVAAFPSSDSLTIGKIDQKVRLALDVGGEVSAPASVVSKLNAVPGVSVKGATLEASAESSASLFLSFALTLPKLVGGVDGAARRARWQFYKRGEPLIGEHVVFTSIRVPRGTRELRFVYRTWARVPRLFHKDALYTNPDKEHVLKLMGV